MKTDFVCHTNGKGLWTKEKKDVRVKEVLINYYDEENHFGELIAKFDQRNWQINVHGLVYTDPQWIKEFREELKNKHGFSDKAVKDISYSEQGMQGTNYISMDVGKHFLKEWRFNK